MSSTVTDVKAYQWYAGGQWRDVANGQLFDDFEPYTGNLYARVADCGAEEARLAIAAAHEAFGAWAETPPVEKARLFFNAAEIVRRRGPQVAGILARETGSTIPFSTFHTAAAANEETFGPLVLVDVVDTAEQAVEVANRTQYGLTSTTLAADTYKAFELAPKILHGIVNVNSPTVNDEIHAPMGGVRSSGSGRTGPECLADFSAIIWINTTSAERQFP